MRATTAVTVLTVSLLTNSWGSPRPPNATLPFTSSNQSRQCNKLFQFFFIVCRISHEAPGLSLQQNQLLQRAPAFSAVEQHSLHSPEREATRCSSARGEKTVVERTCTSRGIPPTFQNFNRPNVRIDIQTSLM